MSTKNIVIFTNTLLSGGAEKQAMLLAIKLKDDYNIFLVVYYGEKVEEKFQNNIIEYKINTIYLHGTHFKRINSFYKLLKQNNISIIFSYLLTTNLIGALIGKIVNIPVRVGGIRNAELDKKKLPVQRFINNHLCTHTIFNNYDGLRALNKKGFNITNAFVIPNCFELKTDPIQRAITEPVKIITVGRFVHQKGYFDALQIMYLLKRGGESFKYIIVGFGELEAEIRNKIIELDLSDTVEVVINPSNIADYYLKTDIYLCTSYFEGLSNTIMEALSFSQPVVATNVGDNNRLVYDHINGFVVTESRPELFFEPLKRLIHSSSLRNTMGKESYKIIKEEYSGDAFKNNYENFIKSV